MKEQCNFKRKHEQCPNEAEWEPQTAMREALGHFCFKHRTVAGGSTLVRIRGTIRTNPILVSDLIRHDNQKHTIPLGQVVEVTYAGDEAPWGIYWSNGKSLYDGPTYVHDETGHSVWKRPPPEFKEICLGIKGTVKAIVVGYNRDCDGTPLYFVSDKPIGYDPRAARPWIEAHEYGSWVKYFEHGFSRDSLKLCEGEFIPIRYKDIWHYRECMRGAVSDLYGHKEDTSHA